MTGSPIASDFDLIVIGLGVGGEEVAGRCAEAGMNVLGIERKLVGGECPYWGCIPTKMIVRAGNSLAEAARVMRLAGDAKVATDWSPVHARVREATADWNDEIAVERLEKKGGTFIRGEARIAGRGEVEVDGKSFKVSRGIVIATGGEPSIPPIDGLAEVDYWTNRDAVEAAELPSSLIVLGAGPIGLELAQAFRRFGTDVDIVEVAERAIPMDEPENGEAIGKVLQEEGIRLHTSVAAESVSSTDGGVSVGLSDGRTLQGERILVATGRRSNLANLALETIGLDPQARVLDVDEHMRASEGIWAIGDITGKGAFTHMAMYQAKIAAGDVLGHEHTPADYSAVPRVTFTDPEVASVGMTEAQAKEAGMKVRVGIATTASSARGWIHGPGAEHGVAKLIADTEKEVLVGASVMGPAAGEVLGMLVVAIRERVPVSALRDLIYPYPTFVRGIEDALRDLG